MITPNIIIIYNWFLISHKILWLYYINLHRREAFLGLYGPTITWKVTKEQKNGVMRMWRPLSIRYNRPWNMLLQFSSCTIYHYQMPIKFILICYQAAYHNIHVYLYKEITIYIFISWDFQMLMLYNPSNSHWCPISDSCQFYQFLICISFMKRLKHEIEHFLVQTDKYVWTFWT